MTPDQINEKNGAKYHCRACGVMTGLHWFNGTSCPVCSKPECQATLQREWDEAYREIENRDKEYP